MTSHLEDIFKLYQVPWTVLVDFDDQITILHQNHVYSFEHLDHSQKESILGELSEKMGQMKKLIQN